MHRLDPLARLDRTRTHRFRAAFAEQTSHTRFVSQTEFARVLNQRIESKWQSKKQISQWHKKQTTKTKAKGILERVAKAELVCEMSSMKINAYPIIG